MEVKVITAVMIADLHIPDAHSLKQKRSVVKGMKEKARQLFGTAVAEVGDSDLIQRALLAFSVVGSDRGQLNRQLEKIQLFIEASLLGKAEILSLETQFLEIPLSNRYL